MCWRQQMINYRKAPFVWPWAKKNALRHRVDLHNIKIPAKTYHPFRNKWTKCLPSTKYYFLLSLPLYSYFFESIAHAKSTANCNWGTMAPYDFIHLTKLHFLHQTHWFQHIWFDFLRGTRIKLKQLSSAHKTCDFPQLWSAANGTSFKAIAHRAHWLPKVYPT